MRRAVILLFLAAITANAQDRGATGSGQDDERFLQSNETPRVFAVSELLHSTMSPNFRSAAVVSTSPIPGAIFFQSGFEEEWKYAAPPGWIGTGPNSDSSWHRNDFTDGWGSAAGFVSGYVWSFAGGFSARFHTAGVPAGRHGYMITPDIDLSVASDSVFLSFWWTNGGSGAAMLDSLKIFLSTDGGATFPHYLGYVGPTGNPWLRAIAFLPSQSRQTRIKFQANGDGSSSDILLDEVIVYQKGTAFNGALTIPGTFSSFTDAARRLTLFGVSGPTQISVQAGTYSDSITFPPISGVNATNRITFKSSGGPVAVRRGGALTASTTAVGAVAQRTDDATISLWGADYMTFDGIDVSDRLGTGQNDWGYHIRSFVPTDGATNNTIVNSTIVMNKLNTGTAGIEQETFWALTSQAGANSRNQYSNIIVRSCAVRGIALVGYPPYLDLDNEIGSPTNGRSLIADLGGPGVSPSAIQISAQNGVRVHGVNIDSMSVVSTSLPAIFIGGSTAFADSVVNFQVYDNTIHGILNTGTDFNGILSAIRVGFTSTLSTTVFRGRIYNNIVYDIRAAGTRPDGSIVALYHHATNPSVVEWYNNTVYITNMLIGSGGVNVLFRVNTGTAIVRDNIFVNKSGFVGAGINYGYYKVGGTLVSSNNAVYIDTTLSNQFVGRDGIDYRSLALWQSSASGRDTLSVFHDPHFVRAASAPFDLHIDTMFSTPLESGGVILPAIASDFDGQPRYPNAGYPENPLFRPTAPDIGADEFAGIPLDVVAPTITYNPLANTMSTANRTLANVILTDMSGINIAPGLKPRIYFKKASNANTFVDNTGSTNGWKYTEASGTGSPFMFILDYSLLYPNGLVIAGDTIQYFVVAQDISTPPNIAVNTGTFAIPPSSVALTGAAFPVTGAINNYRIATVSLSGAYTVGTNQPYATLTGSGGLFDAINGGVLSGNVLATIVSDILEPGTHTLREWGENGGSGFTLTIRPSGSTRTLMGNSDGPLIALDGADRCTIDGTLGGAKSLTIRNANAGTNASTIMFRRDAMNNVITNCIIEGAASGDSSGTIVFGSGAFGNSANIVENSEIRDRSDSPGMPTNAVLSVFSRNSLNAIRNNNIFNWSRSAVWLPVSRTGNDWRITSNAIYQTGRRTTRMMPIDIEAGNGHTVAGNMIGGSSPDRSGEALTTSFAEANSTAFTGISLAVGEDSATTVSANIIANIRCTNSVGSAFEGIRITAGRVNVTGNTVGGGTNPWDTIGTIGSVPGAIQCSGGNAVLVSNNVISSVRTRDSLLFGISVEGSASCIVAQNTIHHLQSTSTVAPVRGISILSAGSIIERNTLYSLSNASTGISPTIISGIHIGSVAPSSLITHVRRNRLYGLSVSGTGLGLNAPRVGGIYAEGQAAVHCYNNMVALGSGVAGDLRLNGLEDAGSARNKWYYNSVFVGGQHPVVGTNGTSAFARTGAAPDTLRDNILCNLRARGIGGHFAISNTNGANWNAGTSNYNLLFAGNADGVARWMAMGYSLTAWRGVSGGDGNSLFGDPRFVSEIDLHCRTDTLSPANNAAIPIVAITNDFDGDPRDPLAPDIGADEFGPSVSVRDVGQILPVSFGLEQNYPNPFNPGTSFEFRVQSSQLVSLEVYDVLGRIVATLVNEVKQPGEYRVQWDASHVASGIYFYRLAAGSFVDTKKCVLMK